MTRILLGQLLAPRWWGNLFPSRRICCSITKSLWYFARTNRSALGVFFNNPIWNGKIHSLSLKHMISTFANAFLVDCRGSITTQSGRGFHGFHTVSQYKEDLSLLPLRTFPSYKGTVIEVSALISSNTTSSFQSWRSSPQFWPSWCYPWILKTKTIRAISHARSAKLLGACSVICHQWAPLVQNPKGSTLESSMAKT